MSAEAEQETTRAVERLAWQPRNLQSSALAADVYALRAEALLALGDDGEAERAARRAVSLVPDHAAAHASLAQALEAQGRLEDAASEYRSALQCLPRVAHLPVDRAAAGWRSLLGLGSLEIRLGHGEEAHRLILEARSRAPGMPQVKAALAKNVR